MALFKKVEIRDAGGNVVASEKAGPLSNVSVKQTDRGMCVTKQGPMGVSESTTCVHQPEVSIKNDNSSNNSCGCGDK